MAESLRHKCLMCGRSCQGIYIPMLGDDAARVEVIARRMGIDDPIDDGKLRLAGGACVFLTDDGLCGIHRELGFEAKPTVCKQYPLVAIRTESEVRVGVDPSCYTAIRTWRTGPEVPEQRLTASKLELDERLAAQEAGLLALIGRDGQTLAGIAAGLAGRDPGDGLPADLAGRFVTRLQAADLQGKLSAPGTAPALIETLSPIAKAAPRWDPSAPPAWPAIGEDEDAWGVEVVRRMVFLRLAPLLPTPATTALLTLMGAVAAGWASEGGPGYGPTLSGWVRAIRSPLVFGALVPDAATLGWLATGR